MKLSKLYILSLLFALAALLRESTPHHHHHLSDGDRVCFGVCQYMECEDNHCNEDHNACGDCDDCVTCLYNQNYTVRVDDNHMVIDMALIWVVQSVEYIPTPAKGQTYAIVSDKPPIECYRYFFSLRAPPVYI